MSIVACGSTNPGAGWKPYEGNGNGIYIDVDTSSEGFTRIPTYVTSIGGRTEHWALVGVSAVYKATVDSFRVYVQWRDGAELTPARAKENGWYVNWIACVEGPVVD